MGIMGSLWPWLLTMFSLLGKLAPASGTLGRGKRPEAVAVAVAGCGLT